MKKLVASTIIESITSLIIFLICFGFSIALLNKYSTFGTSDNSYLKQKIVLDEISGAINSKSFYDEEKEVGKFEVKRIVYKYKEDGIYVLEVSAGDKKGSFSHKSLIRQ